MDKRVKVVKKIDEAERAIAEITEKDFKDIEKEAAIKVCGKIDLMREILYQILIWYINICIEDAEMDRDEVLRGMKE